MKRLAVLGHPIGHSRSPAMHSAALAALGLGAEWSYEAVDVAPEELASTLRSMEDQGFVGANVTIPHKRAAFELADTRSPVAAAIGAANTLSFGRGRIAADNTDAEGLVAALPRSPAGARALVLGAGGAGRAALWALREEGARVEVWNRTAETAVALSRELGAVAVAEPEPANYDLLVNATSVGLGAEDDPFARLPLEPSSFTPSHVVVDLVYGERETALLTAARRAGARVVDGVEVLVRQGAASLRAWTGMEPPLAVMREAART